MRIGARWIWVVLGASASVGAVTASCSNFDAADVTPNDAATDAVDNGDAASDAADATIGDAGLDAVACPSRTPTGPACESACVDRLPLPPGTTIDARIAVQGDRIYLLRATSATTAELLSSSLSAAAWQSLGTYSATGLFGVATTDTKILLSMQVSGQTDAGTDAGADAGANAHSLLLVQIDGTCTTGCTGTPIAVGGETVGGNVVSVDKKFFFGSGSAVLTLAPALTPNVVAPEFGGPILGSDCSYVYWSNSFDSRVHRYDVAHGLSSEVAGGLFDGVDASNVSYPSTIALAVSDTTVFASTGIGRIMKMPKEPKPDAAAQVLLPRPSRALAVDERFLYFASPSGAFLSYDIVRVGLDGSNPVTVSTGAIVVTDMTSDRDFLYVADKSGQITRIKK